MSTRKQYYFGPSPAGDPGQLVGSGIMASDCLEDEEELDLSELIPDAALTPEQRFEAIADILARAYLAMLKAEGTPMTPAKPK